MPTEQRSKQPRLSARRERTGPQVVWLRSGGKMSLRRYERLKAEAVPQWSDDGALESNADIAVRLWNTGWGQGQIAEVLGPSSGTIRKFLVAARSRGFALRRYRGKLPGDPCTCYRCRARRGERGQA